MPTINGFSAVQRRQLSGKNAATDTPAPQGLIPSGLDTVTGLHYSEFIGTQLKRDSRARAKIPR